MYLIENKEVTLLCKLNSTLMTPEYWKKRSTWKKFVGWMGNLLTPFL
ncbi:hypothetical protein [Bacteroides heparinolyticus]